MNKIISNEKIYIIGAGASGLFAAYQLAKRGYCVTLLDHSDKLGKKILISGGGRCNFTNLYVDAQDYQSTNPHFVKSALSRFTPYDIIDLMAQFNIPYYEKEDGQLFCQNSSKDILQMLLTLVVKSNTNIITRANISSISKKNEYFQLTINKQQHFCTKLIIATGGISYPQLGSSDFGLKIAKQFGHKIIPPTPALVGLQTNIFSNQLSGITQDVTLSTKQKSFSGPLLFTHRGISGPVVLNCSLFWNSGEEISINFLPTINAKKLLVEEKQKKPQQLICNLSNLPLSRRLLGELITQSNIPSKQPLQEISNKHLYQLAEKINRFKFTPIRTEGFKRAEVMRGGIDTTEISSKDFQSQHCANLFFIGEVLDVTGKLGGFNLHWAWASAYALAESL